MFEDIKLTMGVALINLVWRRLAVNPSVLHWSWKTLKPHYQSGKIPAAAWQLRTQLELPVVDPINTTERDNLKHELKEAAIIDDVLRTYERGNAQNLIALFHLQSCLNSADSSVTNPESAAYRSSDTNPLSIEPCAKERADGLFGELPDLPLLENLPADIRSLVARSSEIWVPAKYQGLTPSVFRHLTYWPDLLLLIAHRLEGIERVAYPAIEPVAVQTLKSAERFAASMDNAAQPNLKDHDRQWLQGVLDVFIEGMLARGVVIVPTLRTLLA